MTEQAQQWHVRAQQDLLARVSLLQFPPRFVNWSCHVLPAQRREPRRPAVDLAEQPRHIGGAERGRVAAERQAVCQAVRLLKRAEHTAFGGDRPLEQVGAEYLGC